MDVGHARVRIVIRAVDTGTEEDPHDRGPLDPPVAILYDAGDIGAGEWLNTPGEIHWTLPISHPQLSVLEPYLVHFALEIERDVVGWVEVLAGLVTDFDASDQEVVFYGTDYVGLLGRLHEERFSKTDPDAAYNKGGSKYSKKAISFIIENQLKAAKALKYSPVGFITVPTIDDWPEQITINAVFKERLSFILGLMQSHAAGTGKRTRLKTVKTGPLTYRWDAVDDPGTNRDDLRFEYGGLAQGFQVVAFDDFGTKVMGVGQAVAGLKPMFAIATPPDSSDTGKSFPEWLYGSFPKTMIWQDLIDQNDLKRRAALLARRTGKVGKKVGVGIRVDSLDVKVGWDICDAVPMDIVRGAVDTTKYGSGYYVIVGWEFKVYRDGHTDLVLSFQPRDDDIAVDLTLLPSDPLEQPGTWIGQSGCGHPNTFDLPPDVHWYFDHCSGLIYEKGVCDDVVYSQCVLLPAGGAAATFITRREGSPATYFAPSSPYNHIQANQQRLLPYLGGGLQESRGILRYSVPTGATHVHLKLRMWGSAGVYSYDEFGVAPTTMQEFRWTVQRTTLAVGHTSFSEGAAFSEANWTPTGAVIASGVAEGYSFYQHNVAVPGSGYNELTGFDIDTVIPVTPGEDLVLMLLNTSTEGYQSGSYPEAVYDFSDAAHKDTSSVVGWRDYTIDAHAGSETLMHPIGCEDHVNVDLCTEHALLAGTAHRNMLRVRAGVPSIGYSTTTVAASNDTLGSGMYRYPSGLGGQWQESRQIGTYNLPAGTTHVRVKGTLSGGCGQGQSIVPDGQPGAGGYWPQVMPYAWRLLRFTGVLPTDVPSTADAWGATVTVVAEGGGEYPIQNSNWSAGVDVVIPLAEGETTIALLFVNDSTVGGTGTNGFSAPTSGLMNVDPGGLRANNITLTGDIVGSFPLLVRPIECGDTTTYCWTARPPIAWTPDDVNNPVPALGQFVPERLIAIGDGVNAYFYCSTDMGVTGSPYAPGTVRIRVDGLYQGVGESNPATGQILLGFIPDVGEKISAEWRRAVA